jgi:hypothetical protein
LRALGRPFSNRQPRRRVESLLSGCKERLALVSNRQLLLVPLYGRKFVLLFEN